MINLSLSSAKTRYYILILLLLGNSFYLPAQTISTIVGGSSIGDGKFATTVGLPDVGELQADSSNNIYILDRVNKRIRKIDHATGIITSIAGTGIAKFAGDGGPAIAASLLNPLSMALDRQENIYIGDGYRIRKINAATGIISTIAGNGTVGPIGDGGLAINAQLQATSIDIDNAGNVYFLDKASIRRIDAATGIVTTVAGTGTNGYTGNGGPATSAQLWSVRNIAVDSAGNIFINEGIINIIRKVTAATGIIDIYAGIPYSNLVGHSGDFGPATSANIGSPYSINADKYGDLYLTTTTHRIRKIYALNGIIVTIAGDGTQGYQGDGASALYASFSYPRILAVNRNGNIYLHDYYNNVIRKIDSATNFISTVAGSGYWGYAGMGGSLSAAQITAPSGLAVDTARNLYIAELNRIYLANTGSNTLTVAAGTGYPGNGHGEGGPAAAANISDPTGLVTDKTGNLYFIEEGRRVRKIDAVTGIITSITNGTSWGYAGDNGPAINAEFYDAASMAIDKDDNLYIADQRNNRVRKITAATGIITTVAGNGVGGNSGDAGLATAAKLYLPISVAIDSVGNLYIAEGTNNNGIRRVDAASGIITTIIGGKGISGYGVGGDGGPAADATIAFPYQLSVDKNNDLYFVDKGSNRVRKINMTTGIITTVAGTGYSTFNGDNIPATTATLNQPKAIVFDPKGNWYIADYGNNRIRKVTQYSQLKAIAFYDNNGNNTYDPGEKLADDIKVNISRDGFSRTLFTKNGIAMLDADSGSYQISATPALYFIAELSRGTIDFTNTVRIDSVTIAITSFPGEKDMQVALLALDPARPGTGMHYRIMYKNTGTAFLTNVPVTFIKNSKVSFVSSAPAYSTIKGDTLTWMLPALQPRDTGTIDVYTTLAASSVASIGDVLHSNAYVKVSANLTMDDDTARIKQVVTGSYEPNDKTELHKGILTPTQLFDGEYLTYLVRFQNTGTDTALTVEVRDTLDANLDWESFQMLAASHNYELSISDGNHLTWKFNNIKLPDSNTNQKASQGFVSFRIRANWDMDPNDTVRNTCAIYFDANPPVITNTTSTAIDELPVFPPIPALNTAITNYCAANGDQKFKITNLPAASGTIAVRARLNTTLLTIAADSTITLSPQQLGSGSYAVNIEYTNDAGEKSVNYPFTIAPAVNPDVDISADKTTIAAPAEKVNITATNKKDGGSSPLYTFAKDKAFTNILQAESSNNKLVLDGDNYTNGDIWVYVRMKTSEACFVTATNIDSIKVTKNVVTTGIVDADNPATIIMGYPNPFNNQVVVGGLSAAKSYRIYVYDNLGRLVHQQAVYNRSFLSIPTTSWKTGSYWITLFDNRKNKLLGSMPVTKQ
jgi:sugar lactone lactonase YvrE